MKIKYLVLAWGIVVNTIYVTAQETSNFTDARDSKVYKTVIIGKQNWISENLDTYKFRNGDLIPEAKTKEEWIKASAEKTPAWCYYDITESKSYKFGKLYNWYAVTDPRGIAPEGWHVPSDAEWTSLTVYLTGGSPAKKAKSRSNITERGSTIKKSGFEGLPGGYRDELGEFNDFGFDGGWWSSTESSNEDAWGRGMYYLYGNVFRYDLTAEFCYYNKEFGLSVRCIHD
jgi:uncharacterized protein (TIGR02145 family)